MKGNTKAKTPAEYISSLTGERKEEIQKLDALIKESAPNLKPYIQSGMLGYGTYHYKYASKREGDWFVVGLASQKNYISVYVCMTDKGEYLAEKHKKDLPKANIGKSCIRFKRTADIDLKVLKKLVKKAAKIAQNKATSGQAREVLLG